jgi:hypothetical protein
MQSVDHHHLPDQSAPHHSAAVSDDEAYGATDIGEQHTPIPQTPQSPTMESECWQQQWNLPQQLVLVNIM